MTPSWDPKLSKLLTIAGRVHSQFSDECDEVSTFLKLELLLAFLETKNAKGFILIDFPHNLNAISELEKLLTGSDPNIKQFKFYESGYEAPNLYSKQATSSIFTHFIRLLNISPLYSGLNLDEINEEEFASISNFYKERKIHSEIEYSLLQEACDQTVELLDQRLDLKCCQSGSNQNFIRMHRTLRLADVELQVNMEEKETNLKEACKDQWIAELSKFYAIDQICLWNSLLESYEEKISKTLDYRSDIGREAFSMSIYYEIIREAKLNESCDFQPYLDVFVCKFQKVRAFNFNFYSI